MDLPTVILVSVVVGAFSGALTSSLLSRRRSDPLGYRDVRPPEPPDDRPVSQGCTRPPLGWVCTREAGHDGPCAAHPLDWDDPRR